MSVAPGHLRVRVRAAGLNRADLSVVGPASGRERAGEVIEVGPGVDGWSAGDRLMGRGAGFAAEAVMRSGQAMAVPTSLSWEEAGALPVALTTMHDALATNGRLRPGGRVLVHAATSGVGVAGVQLAALLGATTVFATSRSVAKLEVLRDHVGELGCELVVIDTSATPFEAVASDVEVIVDNVGASVLAGNIAAAAVTGRIVQVGRLGGGAAEIDLEELARKRIALIGVTFRTRSEAEVDEIVRLAAAAVEGRLDAVRPRIDRVFPLSALGDAFQALAADTHVGKLVVVPD